jgi:hypothetical protein
MSPIDKDLVAVLLKSDNVDTAYEVWQAFDQSIQEAARTFKRRHSPQTS